MWQQNRAGNVTNVIPWEGVMRSSNGNVTEHIAAPWNVDSCKRWADSQMYR